MEKKTDISIIIRTKNEEDWIGHVIQSVLDQLYKHEIIIVDNDSNDSTLDIVRHFIQEPLLEKINKKYTHDYFSYRRCWIYWFSLI